MDSCEVVFDGGVSVVPRRLMEDARGVIAFGFSLHRVPTQVRASQVDPQCRLPIAEGFVSLERKIPPGASVRFGQSPRAITLPRHARHLLGSIVHTPVFSQQIHSRRLHVFVKSHRRSTRARLHQKRVFQQHMAGEFQVVLRAPIADLLGKRADEQMGHAVEKLHPRLAERRAGSLIP